MIKIDKTDIEIKGTKLSVLEDFEGLVEVLLYNGYNKKEISATLLLAFETVEKFPMSEFYKDLSGESEEKIKC